MKRCLFLGLILPLVGSLLWFVFLRNDDIESKVRFTYSRTMEHKTPQGRQARVRLRENTCRALRLLFSDWAWGSKAGEKTFCETVKARLVESLGDEGRMSCPSEVDALLRGLRFAIIEGPADEVPVACEFSLGPGSPPVVNALVEVLKECMIRYIERENLNWAEKATMDLGIELQRRERELVALRNKYLKAGTDAEKFLLKRKIEDVELLAGNAKKERERGMNAYRERMDASIEFPK